MISRKTVTVLAVAALVLTTGTACEPQEGNTCKTPGEFWTHVDGKKRVSLSCEPSGIDPDGRQIYRWVKA